MIENTNPPIGRLASGEIVVERLNSHMNSHAVAPDLLVEALGKITAGGCDFLVTQVDFDRVVGTTGCVATTGEDHVFFAQRPNRKGLTRFVSNRAVEPCSSMVVILMKITDDAEGTARFCLITAFIGKKAAPEPWDVNAFSKQPDPDAARVGSIAFWSKHAIVAGSDAIVDGTTTDVCPW